MTAGLATDAPLAGLTVVEIGQYIAAPYAGVLFADLGARVIKVEPPHGDGIRTWGPFLNGESAPFMAYNRGKEGVVADLATSQGRDLLEALIARADVVVENNRPGVLERFNFDAEAARERHPHLVYCSITGYGADSPYAQRPGFDLVIQGVTGLISVTGHEGKDFAKVAVPIVDGTAALHAVVAALSALIKRGATGEGATINISLQASTMTWMMLLAAGYFGDGQAPRRLGSAHPFAAPYQVFHAADGPLTIAAGNARQWDRLCAVLDLEHLREDPRFATNPARVTNVHTLVETLEQRLQSRPRAHWIDELSAAGVPCGLVNTLPEALEDPALAERGLVVEIDHPLAGKVRAIGNPIEWSACEAAARRSPLRGEHTERIAAELGVHAEVADGDAAGEKEAL